MVTRSSLTREKGTITIQKNKQIMAMARSGSFNEYKARDPEFQSFLARQKEEDLMYRPEKDRMPKSSELTDDMEMTIAEIAGSLGGGMALRGLLGAALKSARSYQGLGRGTNLLPGPGSSLTPPSGVSRGLSQTVESRFQELLKHGLVQEIKNQPYIGEVLKYMR